MRRTDRRRRLNFRGLPADQWGMSQPQQGGHYHPEYEALRREYNDFRYYLPDALIEVDLASFQVLYANRMAEIVLGVSANDVKAGLNGSSLIAAEDVPRLIETLSGYINESRAANSRYTRTGTQDILYVTMRRLDGTTFPAETQSSFVLDADGVPVRMLSLIRDLSQRQRRE